MNSDPRVSHGAQVSVTQLSLNQGHIRESCVTMETAPSFRTDLPKHFMNSESATKIFQTDDLHIEPSQKILEVVNGAFFTSRRFVRKIRSLPAFLPSFSSISGARAVCWGGVRTVAMVSTASALRKRQASGNTDVQTRLTSQPVQKSPLEKLT